MAGSRPNLHTMDSRSACIQGVLKAKVKVKGHVIRALSWILGMSYTVIDGLVFKRSEADNLFFCLLLWNRLLLELELYMHHVFRIGLSRKPVIYVLCGCCIRLNAKPTRYSISIGKLGYWTTRGLKPLNRSLRDFRMIHLGLWHRRGCLGITCL